MALHTDLPIYKIGLLRQATHSHADRTQLSHALLRRGRCVNGALTKTFQTAAP